MDLRWNYAFSLLYYLRLILIQTLVSQRRKYILFSVFQKKANKKWKKLQFYVKTSWYCVILKITKESRLSMCLWIRDSLIHFVFPWTTIPNRCLSSGNFCLISLLRCVSSRPLSSRFGWAGGFVSPSFSIRLQKRNDPSHQSVRFPPYPDYPSSRGIPRYLSC